MTIDTMIEVGMFIITTLVSLGVGIGLFLNARAHERSVQALAAKIKQAGITLRHS
jgi:hypothetical protein